MLVLSVGLHLFLLLLLTHFIPPLTIPQKATPYGFAVTLRSESPQFVVPVKNSIETDSKIETKSTRTNENKPLPKKTPDNSVAKPPSRQVIGKAEIRPAPDQPQKATPVVSSKPLVIEEPAMVEPSENLPLENFEYRNDPIQKDLMQAERSLEEPIQAEPIKAEQILTEPYQAETIKTPVAENPVIAPTVATANITANSTANTTANTEAKPEAPTPNSQTIDTGGFDSNQDTQMTTAKTNAKAWLTDQLATMLRYPALARKNGWQEEQQIEVFFGADGQMEGFQFLTASDYPILQRKTHWAFGQLKSRSLRCCLGITFSVVYDVAYQLDP